MNYIPPRVLQYFKQAQAIDIQNSEIQFKGEAGSKSLGTFIELGLIPQDSQYRLVYRVYGSAYLIAACAWTSQKLQRGPLNLFAHFDINELWIDLFVSDSFTKEQQEKAERAFLLFSQAWQPLIEVIGV